MKRSILLAVCAAVSVGVVPSQAACVEDLPQDGYACAGPVSSYEACLWANAADNYSENCFDTNRDASYDFYVYGYGYGDVYHYHDIGAYEGRHIYYVVETDVACSDGFVNIETLTYDFGTC